MDKNPSDSSDLEKELYRRIDEVTHYIWDPIGVSGVSEARDEYYSYLPEIQRLLLSGADESTMTTYLARIQTESMGLPSNTDRAKEAARILLNWYRDLKENKLEI